MLVFTCPVLLHHEVSSTLINEIHCQSLFSEYGAESAWCERVECRGRRWKEQTAGWVGRWRSTGSISSTFKVVLKFPSALTGQAAERSSFSSFLVSSVKSLWYPPKAQNRQTAIFSTFLRYIDSSIQGCEKEFVFVYEKTTVFVGVSDLCSVKWYVKCFSTFMVMAKAEWGIWGVLNSNKKKTTKMNLEE